MTEYLEGQLHIEDAIRERDRGVTSRAKLLAELYWNGGVPEFTESVCGDGAAILRDGQPITISEILQLLNRGAKIGVL